MWVAKERHVFSGSQGKQGGVIPNPGMGKEVFNNFYWEHLDRFADTAACLYRLPGAEVKFDWGEEEEDSFQK